ncbi:hypothetical protein ATKI12_7960 [Kitasatospora sp. Ki12]
MDVIYAALQRRETAGPIPAGEADEVRAVLWAHARPDDALQHVTVNSEADRVDLIVYLATRDPGSAADSLARVHALVSRGHQASPLMQRRYLPPSPPGH